MIGQAWLILSPSLSRLAMRLIVLRFIPAVGVRNEITPTGGELFGSYGVASLAQGSDATRYRWNRYMQNLGERGRGVAALPDQPEHFLQSLFDVV